LTGRCKTLFAWGVIAVAGLIYLASLLPVVAAMEEGGVVVSDQLPSSARDTFSMIMDGTGEPQADTATTDTEISRPEGDAGLGTQFSTTPATAPPEETAVTQASAAGTETNQDPGDAQPLNLGDATPAESGETTSTDSGEALAESEVTTPTDSGDTTPTEPGDSMPTEPDEAEPAETDPTKELDPADPEKEVIEPEEPTLEELLASFIETRLGLVLYGSTGFPITDVDATGEFVFHISAIIGSNFSATKGRSIPSGFSALTTYGNGTINGLELFKNMRHDPHYGDCHIAMSADGSVSFNNLTMEVTELYSHQLHGVRLFPLVDFWTTNPGEDLPLGEDEEPLPLDVPFYGDDFKVTIIKMTADHIEIPNFSISVAPGKKQLES